MADMDVFAAMGISGFGKNTSKKKLDPSRFDKNIRTKVSIPYITCGSGLNVRGSLVLLRLQQVPRASQNPQRLIQNENQSMIQTNPPSFPHLPKQNSHSFPKNPNTTHQTKNLNSMAEMISPLSQLRTRSSSKIIPK